MTTAAQVIAAQPLLDARRRVEQIRTAVEDIKGLIVDAYRARDWETLGYVTWDVYCREEFGGTIAIPREERGDVVFTLRDAGLSTRAIGAAIGVDHVTVVNDLKSGGEYSPPATGPTTADPDDEVVDAEIVEAPDTGTPAQPAPEPRITGTDGKSYSAVRSPSPTAKTRNGKASSLRNPSKISVPRRRPRVRPRPTGSGLTRRWSWPWRP